MSDIITYIIIAAIVIVVGAYAFLLNRKINSAKSDLRMSELEERRKSVKVNKVVGFIPPKIITFHNVLKSAMPSNYIIIPNAAIELLFQRANRKDLALEGTYATFCVLTANFAPVLVIELVDYSGVTDSVFKIPQNIKELLIHTGIPVMQYEIRDSYSIDDLRRKIAKAMNPLYSS